MKLQDSSQFKKIIELSEKIKDIPKGANTINAPLLLRDFIIAIDIATDLLANAVRQDSKAHARLKQAESIAYFDKAPVFLKEKGVRESSDAKKMYVPQDADVMEAMDLRGQTEAMVVFLKNKLQEFRMAHDDVKKIAYSSDYNNSSNEGL